MAETPINNFKRFADGDDANVISDETYAQLLAQGGGLQHGFQQGIAYSNQENKVLRQVTSISTAIAQIVVDRLKEDIADNMPTTELADKIFRAFGSGGDKQYFDQDYVNKFGGYSVGKIVWSRRFPWLAFESMIDKNTLDPDDPAQGATPGQYWDSGAQPGNGWALWTIPARRANSGLGYTSDFRLITEDALNLPKTTIASYKGSVYWENVKWDNGPALKISPLATYQPGTGNWPGWQPKTYTTQDLPHFKLGYSPRDGGFIMPPLPTQGFTRVVEVEINAEWAPSSNAFPTNSPSSVIFGVTNANHSGSGPTDIGSPLITIPYYQLRPVVIGSDPYPDGPLSFKQTSMLRNQSTIKAASFACLWLGLQSSAGNQVTARKLWINFTVTDVRI